MLREQIIKLQIRSGGDWHQAEGTPLFEDGTIGSFSYRAWGDLLAATWSEEDQVGYSYMDFYMGEGTTKEVAISRSEKPKEGTAPDG